MLELVGILPTELVELVFLYWLKVSPAPMTLRHAAAKYFDALHGLNGRLAKQAIRKISPYHPFYKVAKTIPHFETNIEHPQGDEYTVVSRVIIPIATTDDSLYFPVKESHRLCKHRGLRFIKEKNYHICSDTLFIRDSQHEAWRHIVVTDIVAVKLTVYICCNNCKYMRYVTAFSRCYQADTSISSNIRSEDWDYFEINQDPHPLKGSIYDMLPEQVYNFDVHV